MSPTEHYSNPVLIQWHALFQCASLIAFASFPPSPQHRELVGAKIGKRIVVLFGLFFFLVEPNTIIVSCAGGIFVTGRDRAIAATRQLIKAPV
jgi:hypothetical protein